jgi:hypothetical protein
MDYRALRDKESCQCLCAFFVRPSLVIIPDLQSLVVSSNGHFYTKQLMGDNYNDITTVSKRLYSFKLTYKGDEIQLFYRRKWYDDD